MLNDGDFRITALSAAKAERKQAFSSMYSDGLISKEAMKSICDKDSDMQDEEYARYVADFIRSVSGRLKIKKLPEYENELTKKAHRVTKTDPYINMLFEIMAQVMYSNKGVGLAANQIGLYKRLVVADIGEGLIKLLNPVIVDSSGEQALQESCLSIPGAHGVVKRPETIVINTRDSEFKIAELKAKGLLARVICHEIDHLDGILFTGKTEPGTLKKESIKSLGL